MGKQFGYALPCKQINDGDDADNNKHDHDITKRCKRRGGASYAEQSKHMQNLRTLRKNLHSMDKVTAAVCFTAPT